jgi:hypothetical protein
MLCNERNRIVLRLCDAVNDYNERVLAMQNLRSEAFSKANDAADIARLKADAIRSDLNRHERMHKCGRSYGAQNGYQQTFGAGNF